MTLDEIFENWDKDSKIDRMNLAEEVLNIPKLHNKYYRIYVNERLILAKQESDLKRIECLRHDFYSGVIDDESLKEMGWMEEFSDIGRRNILKSEIPRYLNADKVVVDKNLKISLQREKVQLLDSIIKSLTNRGYQIKSAIDFIKFQAGA